jgi:hypothetical protein
VNPQVLKRLAKEIAELAANPPDGIKVIVNEENITDIQALIQGPGALQFSFVCLSGRGRLFLKTGALLRLRAQGSRVSFFFVAPSLITSSHHVLTLASVDAI